MALRGRREEQRLLLPNSARETHLIVPGGPGTGKSRALIAWALQDVRAGRGVGFVDVHGDAVDLLTDYVALLALQSKDIAERVVYVNLADPAWIVQFDPLEAIQGFSPERLATFLTDVMIKIWHLHAADTPRLLRLMTMTFLALASLGLHLVDLPRFLTDEDWRESCLPRIRNPDVGSYFHNEFPRTAGGQQQWLAPVLNKIGTLLFDPDLRLMFSGPSTINFRRILDRGLILLVNLSKGLLGEENSALLGAFLVAHLQKAALARADQVERPPYYLYLDEFQNYTTDNIKDVLAESRKYALRVVLAFQYLAQLSTDLLGAVLNTTGAIACFRLGYQDASLLARELFAPGYLEWSQWELGWTRFAGYPLPWPQHRTAPLTREELILLLTHQDQRQFWFKQRGPYPPFHLRSLDMPSLDRNETLTRAREELIGMAGPRYGRLKAEVQREAEGIGIVVPQTIDGQYRILNDWEES